MTVAVINPLNASFYILLLCVFSYSHYFIKINGFFSPLLFQIKWRSCPGSPGPGAAPGLRTGKTPSASPRSWRCPSWRGCCAPGRPPATTQTKCGRGSTSETSESIQVLKSSFKNHNFSYYRRSHRSVFGPAAEHNLGWMDDR